MLFLLEKEPSRLKILDDMRKGRKVRLKPMISFDPIEERWGDLRVFLGFEEDLVKDKWG